MPRVSKTSPNRKSITKQEAIKLWAASAGRCNVCWTDLLRDETTDVEVKAGEMAHIVGIGEGPRSPRSDYPLDKQHRDLANNLILLCEKHHTEVDTRPELYSVEFLRGLKRKAEERVHFLTGLKEDRKTAILRLLGTIHGTKVPDLSREDAREIVLHQDGRYPHTDQQHVVDLREEVDEGTPNYWAHSDQKIANRVRIIRDRQAQGDEAHISAFGLARIPVLVQLGHHLGDAGNVTVYHRRNDGGWGWNADASLPSFEIVEHGSAAENVNGVALACSLTAPVDLSRAEAAVAGRAVYEIRPADHAPGHTLLDHPTALEAFSATYRKFLSSLEVHHQGIDRIALVPAVPADAAIALGQVRTPATTPVLEVFDRDSDSGLYEYTTDVGG